MSEECEPIRCGTFGPRPESSENRAVIIEREDGWWWCDQLERPACANGPYDNTIDAIGAALAAGYVIRKFERLEPTNPRKDDET